MSFIRGLIGWTLFVDAATVGAETETEREGETERETEEETGAEEERDLRIKEDDDFKCAYSIGHGNSGEVG